MPATTATATARRKTAAARTAMAMPTATARTRPKISRRPRASRPRRRPLIRSRSIRCHHIHRCTSRRNRRGALLKNPFLSWGRAARFGSLSFYALSLSRVGYGDSHLRELVAQLIRPSEVLGGARLLPLLQQLGRARRQRALGRGSREVETQHRVP